MFYIQQFNPFRPQHALMFSLHRVTRTEMHFDVHLIFAVVTYTYLAGPERVKPVAVDSLISNSVFFMLIFFC